MKKTIDIKVPKSWEAVTLRKYLNLQTQIQNYKDDEEAITAVCLQELCGISPDILTQLKSELVSQIQNDLDEFLADTDFDLYPILTVKDEQLGFIPNLSEMEYGAYLDITKYDTFTIDENWKYIMNILYRPLKHKQGMQYSTKPYEVRDDEDKWLDVTMDKHFGAYFFFISILKDLFQGTLNSLLKEKNLHQPIKPTLQRSGMGIIQSSHWHKMTLLDLMKYSNNH